jgi:hypothetical protein
MVTPPTPPRTAAVRAALLSALARLAFLAGLLIAPAIAQANWLTKIGSTAEHAGARAAKHGAGSLDRAARRVKALPPEANAGVLAAEASQEGHWRFVNRAGETYTAGTPDEMKRAASVLFPDAKPDLRLTLYLAEDTVFRNRAALKELPKGTELNVVVGSDSYRVLRRGEGATERLYAEVRPSLTVEMADRALFDEAVWQLARRIDKASVRVIALEPGGPPRLASAPRIDPSTKRALVDTIDPSSLAAAMGSVRGQTLLITGRIERDLLLVQPSSGPEKSLLVRDLVKAAEDADVNLVLLHSSSTPRQPGGRNWFWQKVEVRGLETALQRPRIADFLAVLAGPDRRLTATARFDGNGRTALDLRPDASGGPVAPSMDVFAELVSGVTGTVVPVGMQAHMRSAERQQELDQRLIPGIPADFQVGYLLLVLLGLLGVPVSLAWWRRLWPPEVASDYAGRTGYIAARTIRTLVFLVVFLPLTAPVSAPYNLIRQVYEAVMAPVRWWRWLMGRPATAA